MKDEHTPLPLSDMKCTEVDGKPTLSFVRQIPHDPGAVWSVLVDAGKIARWAPYAPDHDLDVVGPVTLRMLDDSEPELYESEVLEVIIEQVLTYSWGPFELLTWRLAPSAGGCALSLEHRMEDLELVIPSSAGWQLSLDLAELQLRGVMLSQLEREEFERAYWQQLAKFHASMKKGE